MNNKIFIALIFSLITFSSQSQWGIAYGAGWGNADLKSYPNFFSSIDYVGDGINGHRLDIYFPTIFHKYFHHEYFVAIIYQYLF